MKNERVLANHWRVRAVLKFQSTIGRKIFYCVVGANGRCATCGKCTEEERDAGAPARRERYGTNHPGTVEWVPGIYW